MSIQNLDLCDVKPVVVAGTTYRAHELKTRLRGTGPVKVIVSWKEADLSDNPKYHAASHRGWQAGGVLGRYVRRWEVEMVLAQTTNSSSGSTAGPTFFFSKDRQGRLQLARTNPQM